MIFQVDKWRKQQSLGTVCSLKRKYPHNLLTSVGRWLCLQKTLPKVQGHLGWASAGLSLDPTGLIGLVISLHIHFALRRQIWFSNERDNCAATKPAHNQWAPVPAGAPLDSSSIQCWHRALQLLHPLEPQWPSAHPGQCAASTLKLPLHVQVMLCAWMTPHQCSCARSRWMEFDSVRYVPAHGSAGGLDELWKFLQPKQFCDFVILRQHDARSAEPS